MSIFRLLPFSLVIAVGVAAAQSSPEKTPVAVPSADSIQQNSSSTANPVSSSSKPESSAQKPLDRIRIEQERKLVAAAQQELAAFELIARDDTSCLKMRVYKVARDDPHSDATHAAGYSTCQPAMRFQVYRTDERVLPAKP
jgi:hypothetical protein